MNKWEGRRNEKLFVEGYEAEENDESTKYKTITSEESVGFFAVIVIISMLLFLFYILVHLFTPEYELIDLLATICVVAGGSLIGYFRLLKYISSHNRQLAHDRATAAGIENFHHEIHEKIMKTKKRRDNRFGIVFIDEDVAYIHEDEEVEEPIDDDLSLLPEESSGQNFDYMMNHDPHIKYIMEDEYENEEEEERVPEKKEYVSATELRTQLRRIRT